LPDKFKINTKQIMKFIVLRAGMLLNLVNMYEFFGMVCSPTYSGRDTSTSFFQILREYMRQTTACQSSEGSSIHSHWKV